MQLNPGHTVYTEIFVVLNFCSFSGMPGHPREFNLQIIMVLVIMQYNVVIIKWSSFFDVQCMLQNMTIIEQRTIGFVLV